MCSYHCRALKLQFLLNLIVIIELFQSSNAMKALIQRVANASVTVNEEVISSINRGLCVLIGIHRDDKESDIEFMWCSKAPQLEII
ncbi:D-aminoacyl-tRNA deacylase 1 isoform X2 [Planococcus citri]|uniref:D-aminoacyl-tRNA deacylase 1 isoform X2 n=1 Tax=Planococcus citri TaxID=170843 RepID=UPI0031F84BBF